MGRSLCYRVLVISVTEPIDLCCVTLGLSETDDFVTLEEVML